MNDNRMDALNMPEWLLTDENYSPPNDRDTFVNKSILSFLSILARIKTQDSSETGKYGISAIFKVAFTFMLILLLSLSRSFVFVMIINVYLIVILSLMKAEDIVKILKVSLVMSLFTFILLLPAAFWGNSSSTILITGKVFATITVVNILSRTTKWTSITGALKKFFVPDLFILVLDITIKYIVMLGDFALSMLYALKLRSVGKNKSKYTALSGIGGTLFIKSKEMAEDMYIAMECRGFTGEYHVYNNFKFTIADFGYIMINVGIIVLFVYFGRI
ncbi:energy-coupling factor transporter transmembrane component T family protein [Acetobacterium paludosum]|nr:energy-coupling factor transporter transmembrane component T [Acetobacterium paludosum]